MRTRAHAAISCVFPVIPLSEHRPTPPEPIGYLAVIRNNPSYRALWLGEVVSLFGDWFNLIASAALVASLTQSGFAVGGLFVVRMLAPFLVSPLAGVAADRFNRKNLLILSDLARALVVLGFLVVREPGQAWLLYALTAVQLGISGFFYPTRNALLPHIVSRRELGTANALSSATWSVMLALGAAFGGLVAGQWGIYPAFVIDSLTFLLSALFLTRIRYTAAPGISQAAGSLRHAAVQQYVEGLRYLKEHADILVISLHKAAISVTANGAFQVIQVILAEQVFIIGAGGGTSLGLFYAVSGIGTGLGPIVARRFTGDRERSLRIAIALSYLICFVGLLVTAPLYSFGWVLVGSFLRTFGSGINWVFSTQLLLQALPDQVRGRVFSTEFALFTLANAAGASFAGWALDNTSLDVAGLVYWLALLTLLPAALWVVWLVIRKQPASSAPHTSS